MAFLTHTLTLRRLSLAHPLPHRLVFMCQALKEAKFEAYVSKRTGRTYPGGKVERELEEIEETCDDFLTLALGRMPAAGEDDD